MYYFELLDELYKNNIRYLLVGGLAVNLHHVPRMTLDIDLILSMETRNIAEFIKVLTFLGYSPRLPLNPESMSDPEQVKRWINEKNMKAFSFYHTKENYKVVDVILSHPLDFESSFVRKIIHRVNETELYVITVNDLITMKKFSGRERDLNDVYLLEKTISLENNIHE